MKRILSIAIAAGLIATGCAHKKVTYEGGGFASNEKEGAGVQAQVVWLKNKKDSIDVLLSLTNKYEKPISFKRSGISMTLNGSPVTLRKSNFSGEMAPNGYEKELLIFDTPARDTDQGGVAVLKIDNIFLEQDAAKKDEKKVPPLVLELEVAKQ